jgi:N-glycosylase/DNA lyase
MAYVHIRIDDAFYKLVQSTLQTTIKTDISSFVRDVLVDALLIYGAPSSTEEALAEIGSKHKMRGTPSLILDMAKDWEESQGRNTVGLADNPRNNRVASRLEDYFRLLGSRTVSPRFERVLEEEIRRLLPKRGERT